VTFAPAVGAADRGGFSALLEFDRDRFDNAMGYAGGAEKVVQLMSVLRLMVKRDGGGRITALADVDIRRAVRCCLYQKCCEEAVAAV
jgi:hypothetical protein